MYIYIILKSTVQILKKDGFYHSKYKTVRESDCSIYLKGYILGRERNCLGWQKKILAKEDVGNKKPMNAFG